MPSGKLLYVVNDPKFFLSHRRSLAEAAQVAGYDVQVALPAVADEGSVQAAGFRTHSIQLDRRSLDPTQEIATVRSLVRLYRDARPDLVHHVTIKPVVYGGIASRIAKVPAVVNAVTGLGWVFLTKGLKAGVARGVAQAGYRSAFRHPNMRTIFQNETDLAHFVDRGIIDARRAVLIRGSGVDVERFTPQPGPSGRSPLIVLPGRMLWDKGVGTFVEAARLAKTMTNARFALVGGLDGQNRSAVPEETLSAWHNEGVIEWWGHQANMLDVYRQANVVCLPSRGEGVPLALLEAAACARPLVATDVPGCRDVVRHNENGLLVAAGDPKALARALVSLTDDPARCARMGAAGRQLTVERFSRQKVVAETLAVYSSLAPS